MLYAFVCTNLFAVCTNLCSVCTVHQPGCTNLRAVCSCVLSAPIPQERVSNQYCPACIQSFAIDENQQKRWSISRKRFQRWRQMINLKAGHGDLVLHFQYTEQTSTSKTYISRITLYHPHPLLLPPHHHHHNMKKGQWFGDQVFMKSPTYSQQ